MRDFPFLPPYVLAEELAEGRPILDVHPGVGAANLLSALEIAGVTVVPPRSRLTGTSSPRMQVVHGESSALPARDDSFGVVLCASFALLDATERDRFLAEARRVVGPEGLLIATLPTGADPMLLAPPVERGVDSAELQRAVRRHFPHIALVAQTPFLAYMLQRLAQVGDPGELVLSTSFAGADDPVAHLAVCSARYRRLDTNHLVQLSYFPFDETVRSRIDELADMAEAARWEASRELVAADKARADLAGLSERLGEAEGLAKEVHETRASAQSAETELVELRSRALALDRAVAAAAGARAGAALRAREAEEAARELQGAAIREKKRADGAAGSFEAAQREIRDMAERLARLQRALDDREESLALARDERDGLGRDKVEAVRKLEAAQRELEAARGAAKGATARAGAVSEELDTLRGKAREADRVRETARARIEEAETRLRTLEEELRLARAEARRLRDELDAAQASGETERRERSEALERVRTTQATRERELLSSLEARDDMIRELRAGLEARGASATRLDEEREILKRQLSEARRNLVDAEARAEASEENVRSLKRTADEVQRLSSARDSLTEQLFEANARIVELEADSQQRKEGMMRLEAMVDGLRHESRDAGKLLATLEGEKDRLMTHLQEKEEALAEMQSLGEEARTEAERAAAERARLEAEIESMRKRQEATDRQILSMRDTHEWEAAAWQGERERLEQALSSKSARASTLEKELERAKEVTKTFQEKAAQAAHDAAVKEQEARRKKSAPSVAPAAAVPAGAADELRGHLADEKARAAKAIEEAVRWQATLETVSDVLGQSARLRHAIERLLRARPGLPPAKT